MVTQAELKHHLKHSFSCISKHKLLKSNSLVDLIKRDFSVNSQRLQIRGCPHITSAGGGNWEIFLSKFAKTRFALQLSINVINTHSDYTNGEAISH